MVVSLWGEHKNKTFDNEDLNSKLYQELLRHVELDSQHSTCETFEIVMLQSSPFQNLDRPMIHRLAKGLVAPHARRWKIHEGGKGGREEGGQEISAAAE